MILFIKNIPIEGPETLADFFRSKNRELKTIDLSLGEVLPRGLEGVEAVVVLGGPMNVYEEEKYPFLKDENRFIASVLERKIPFLGICLGAQLLAKAMGVKVTRNPVREIGFSEIQLTAEGKKDPLFAGVVERLNVFQWHEDTFGIPSSGRWLAKSSACRHQAFKAGGAAYGLQFHVEVTDQSIREWCGAYFQKGNATHAIMERQMLAAYAKLKENFHREAAKIYNNFLRIITESRE